MRTIRVSRATIAKMGLTPGDVIVVRVTDKQLRFTAQQVSFVKEDMEAVFPGHQVIVLPYGLDTEKIELEAT